MYVRQSQQPKPITGTLAYVYAARRIRVEHSSQRHHLLDLAARSNKLGQCFATIATLAEDQRVSPDTVHDNNRYWKKRGVLTWVVGVSNQYRREANSYQLDLKCMERIVKIQPAKPLQQGSAEKLLSRSSRVQQTSAEPLLEVCSAAPEGLLRPAGSFAEPLQRGTKNTTLEYKQEYEQEEKTDFGLSSEMQENIDHLFSGMRDVKHAIEAEVLVQWFSEVNDPHLRQEMYDSLFDSEKQQLRGTWVDHQFGVPF